jgi:polar amino acid transport system substrate-binding protein
MTRTDDRESLFKWVGPLATNQWVFYAKKASGVEIGSLDDARKVAAIGTCKDSAAEQFLKKEGFTNIESVVDDSENAKKLDAAEIDLWIVGDLQGVYKAKTAGIDSSGLEKIFEIKDTQLFIAFSKETDESEIAKWQKALDALKAEGTYEKILSKYM